MTNPDPLTDIPLITEPAVAIQLLESCITNFINHSLQDDELEELLAPIQQARDAVKLDWAQHPLYQDYLINQLWGVTIAQKNVSIEKRLVLAELTLPDVGDAPSHAAKISRIFQQQLIWAKAQEESEDKQEYLNYLLNNLEEKWNKYHEQLKKNGSCQSEHITAEILKQPLTILSATLQLYDEVLIQLKQNNQRDDFYSKIKEKKKKACDQYQEEIKKNVAKVMQDYNTAVQQAQPLPLANAKKELFQQAGQLLVAEWQLHHWEPAQIEPLLEIIGLPVVTMAQQKLQTQWQRLTDIPTLQAPKPASPPSLHGPTLSPLYQKRLANTVAGCIHLSRLIATHIYQWQQAVLIQALYYPLSRPLLRWLLSVEDTKELFSVLIATKLRQRFFFLQRELQMPVSHPAHLASIDKTLAKVKKAVIESVASIREIFLTEGMASNKLYSLINDFYHFFQRSDEFLYQMRVVVSPRSSVTERPQQLPAVRRMPTPPVSTQLPLFPMAPQEKEENLVAKTSPIVASYDNEVDEITQRRRALKAACEGIIHSVVSAMALGAGVGAGVGTILPVIGTLTGAVVGAVAGGVISLVSGVSYAWLYHRSCKQPLSPLPSHLREASKGIVTTVATMSPRRLGLRQ